MSAAEALVAPETLGARLHRQESERAISGRLPGRERLTAEKFAANAAVIQTFFDGVRASGVADIEHNRPVAIHRMSADDPFVVSNKLPNDRRHPYYHHVWVEFGCWLRGNDLGVAFTYVTNADGVECWYEVRLVPIVEG